MSGSERGTNGGRGPGVRVRILAVAAALAVGVGAVAIRGDRVLPAGDGAVPDVAAPEAVAAAGASAAGASAGASAEGAPPESMPSDLAPLEAGLSGAADAVAGAVEGAADEAADEASAPAPVEWASPREPSPVPQLPVEERTPRPEAVRGIYVGAWTVGNPGRLKALIELADETEINAFVIDVKDVSGELSHRSRVPLAEQVEATRRVKIPDLAATLARLREHGIYTIARIVAFKDPLLAEARPEWAIEREDGSVWEDNNGVRWVDSYNRDVWDYNIEIAREAVALGFNEVQWDYVRFADVPRSYALSAVYPARDGRSKTDAIREFMIYSKERLADLDVPVTADVFGITTSTRRDIGIGQVWEKMADVMDVLLPMVYPSHYPDGSWDFENPNGAPYQIVKRAMDDGVERSLLIDGAARIRPWLQAFTMGEPEYGPRHMRAQIDAVYDAGLTEWIFWSPSVRYPRQAFASAEGIEPWFAGMGETLYEPPAPETEPVAVQPLGTPAGGGH